MAGTYLTENDRYQIEAYLKAGLNNTEIAEKLGKSARTIRREIRRGTVLLKDSTWLDYYAYCPDHAQLKYEEKKVKKGAKPKIYQDPELLEYVSKKILIEKYSPEAVLEEIKNKNLKFKVTLSKNTIYRCIEKGILKDVTEKDLPIKKNENQKKQECIKEELGMINDFQLIDDQKK